MAYLDIRETRTGTRYRVKYRIDGKERVTTFPDAAQATRWRDVCNAAGPHAALKLLDDMPPPGAPTVREVLHDYIDGRSGVTDGTREDYRRHGHRDIESHLGNMPAVRLTTRDVRAWVNTLEGQGLAAKTIANRFFLLSSALAAAVPAALPANPCTGVRLPRANAQEMTFLEPAEFAALHGRIRPYFQPLVMLLAGTGLRWGEATALRVGDVDLAANRLHVRQAWKHGQRPTLGPPKSKAGRRTVEFGERVARDVKPLVDGRPATALVFLNQQGRPVLNNSFHSRVWGPAVKAAADAGELTRRPRIHDLRHSYAAWCLNATPPVPIYVLSRVLGHETFAITSDRYGHLQPEGIALAAAAAAAALNLMG